MRLFRVAAVAALALVSCFNAVAAENAKVVPASGEDSRHVQLLRSAEEERSKSDEKKNEDMDGEDRIISFKLSFSELYNKGVTPELLILVLQDEQRVAWGYAQYVTYRNRLEEKHDSEK